MKVKEFKKRDKKKVCIVVFTIIIITFVGTWPIINLQKEKTPENLKDYILSKAVTNQIIKDDGTEDHNLRYIGKNPNNYVYFNCEDNDNPTKETCELWRIIGLMNNIDDGTGKKETRIKLIRNKSIGGYLWDNSAVNEWSQASLMKLLNPGYENNQSIDSSGELINVNNSLYWNRQSGECHINPYTVINNDQLTAPCNFIKTGLKSEAKKLIGETLWHTGANDGTEYKEHNILTAKFYELERSSNTGKICNPSTFLNVDTCTDTIERTTTWIGYVGLMYPSDYGYATSGGSNTNRNTCLAEKLYGWDAESKSFCRTNNWLFRSGDQWTMTPYAYSMSASNVFYIGRDGYVNALEASLPFGVTPVIYLKSNIKITSGNGSEENPFILS